MGQKPQQRRGGAIHFDADTGLVVAEFGPALRHPDAKRRGDEERYRSAVRDLGPIEHKGFIFLAAVVSLKEKFAPVESVGKECDMADAQASYDFGRYTVEVSAVNLNGTRAFNTYEYFGFPVVMPVQPRSAFVTLKARF